MLTITDKVAKEKGTFCITVSPYDENGDAVTPGEIKWSLVDQSGNPVNGRQDVAVTPPSASMTILLSGDDLRIRENEAEKEFVNRYLVIQWTYSSSLGPDLPGNEQVAFVLENLKKVT